MSLVLWCLSLLGDNGVTYNTCRCSLDDVLLTYLGRENNLFTVGDINNRNGVLSWGGYGYITYSKKITAEIVVGGWRLAVVVGGGCWRWLLAVVVGGCRWGVLL